MSEPSISAPARSSIVPVLSIILVGRLGLFLLSYLGLCLLPARQNFNNALPGDYLLGGWVQWDAVWYARIAENGYTNQPIDDSGQRDTHFLPMYPMLAAAAGKLVGNVYAGGLLISNTAFIFAGLLLYRLAAAQWGEEISRRALILICVYPFSYAFTAMYTESVHLLFCLAAFWFGQKRWWHLAALCAASAGATRVVGIAMAGALALMYFQNAGWKLRNLRRDALWLPLGFAGFASFLVYCGIKFHEPLALFHTFSAKGWGDWNNGALVTETLSRWGGKGMTEIASGNVPLLLTLHLVLCVIALSLCAVAWKRLPIPYAAWTTVVVLMSFSLWACFGRYLASVFPAFVVAAMLLKDSRLYHGVIYVSTLLLALLTVMFTHGYWVA